MKYTERFDKLFDKSLEAGSLPDWTAELIIFDHCENDQDRLDTIVDVNELFFEETK
jgi:hypothetical protein